MMADTSFKVWMRCFVWLNKALPQDLFDPFLEMNIRDFAFVSAMVRSEVPVTELVGTDFLHKVLFFAQLLTQACDLNLISEKEFMAASKMDAALPESQQKFYLN